MAKLKDVKVLDMEDGIISKVKFEGATYAKTDGKANPGDIIYNRKEGGRGARLADSFYRVVEVDECTRVEDELGDHHGWANECQGDHFDVFRKEVKAEIGMYAKALQDSLDITEGELYEIVDGNEELITVIDDAGDRNTHRLNGSVLEVTEEKPKAKLQEGDYAKVVGTALTSFKHGEHGFDFGEYVKIKRVLKEGSVQCNRLDGGIASRPFVDIEDLKEVGELEALNQTAIGDLEVGDIVLHGGDFAEVEGIGESGYVAAEHGVTLSDGSWRFAMNVTKVVSVHDRLDREE